MPHDYRVNVLPVHAHARRSRDLIPPLDLRFLILCLGMTQPDGKFLKNDFSRIFKLMNSLTSIHRFCNDFKCPQVSF